jgi:hypothetical protein
MSTIHIIRSLCVALGLQLLAGNAIAHRVSQSFVQFTAESEKSIGVQADVALRDLDMVLDLDTDRNGKLTWGEIRAKRGAAWRAISAAIGIRASDASRTICTPTQRADPAENISLVKRSEGTFMRLNYQLRCPETPRSRVLLHYDLFEAFDSYHRAIVRTASAVQVIRTGATLELPLNEPIGEPGTSWSGVASFVGSGLHHILIGWDHLAFLLALIAGAAWVRPASSARAERTKSGEVFSTPLRQLLIIITAFTVAHSVTLSLAVIGYLQLPSGPVEIAIALSVVVAAASNLIPRPRFSWRLSTGLAFAFGLVHGLGFASVMAQVGTDTATLVWSLAGFNLGVEIGQVIFVLVAYALLARCSHLIGSPDRFSRVISVLLIGVGLNWAFQRTLDLGFM